MLPSKIQVGPFVFTVIKKQMESFGETDFDKFTISIKEDMPPEHEREVFNHEIMHACSFLSRSIPLPLEEKFIRAVSPIYYMLMRDNSEVREYLYSVVPD